NISFHSKSCFSVTCPIARGNPKSFNAKQSCRRSPGISISLPSENFDRPISAAQRLSATSTTGYDIPVLKPRNPNPTTSRADGRRRGCLHRSGGSFREKVILSTPCCPSDETVFVFLCRSYRRFRICCRCDEISFAGQNEYARCRQIRQTRHY